MQTKISNADKKLFSAKSEVGGAYDLARYIQYAIYNVFEEDGDMIWK